MEIQPLPQTDFLDLLFEGRNQDYGAFRLRRNYPREIRTGVLSMVLGVIFLGLVVMVFGRRGAESVKNPQWIQMDIHPKQIEFIPSLPPSLPSGLPPRMPKTIRSLVPTTPLIVKEVPKGEKMPDDGQLRDLIPAPGTGNSPGSENYHIDPGLQEEVSPAAPYRSVEQMPQYPGGEAALQRFLGNSIHYPAFAIQNDIQGTVVLQFVVEPDGSISDVKILNQPLVGGGCEQEAIRVVKSMPKWRPGRQNGAAVPVYFTLPVSFRLHF